jgi:acyl-CoA synthetase
MSTPTSGLGRALLHERWRREGWYRGETIAQALHRAARASPDTPYWFHTEAGLRQSTAAEIVGQGQRLAAAFAAIGIGHGDAVAFQLPTSFETAILYVAALHAGASLLPIVHIYGPAETGFILRKARARVLVIPDQWRNIDYLERLTALGPTPDLEHVIIVGKRAVRGARLYSEFQQLASAPPPLPSHSADDVVLLLFTSGTTGEPKGVRQSHNTITCEWSTPLFHRRGPFLNPTPAGHIQGFNFLMRPMFWNVPMVMLERWDADIAAALVQKLRIEQSGGPPFFLMSILEAARRGGHDISSLKSFGLGGAAVTPEHVYMAAREGMTSGRAYGSTEHSTVSNYRPEDPLEVRATTDGRLLPGTAVRIVDEDDREVSLGQEGEILLQGPEQFVGYLDPQHDAEAFTPDGWFRSGDIGRLNEQGHLTITDRKKDLIIRGGENISSVEVEGILLRHPAALEVAVIGVRDVKYGERVCACVVTKPGTSLTLEAIITHFASAGCAKQKTPEKLVILSDLPRTPSGKVRKAELRHQFT